MSLNSAKSIASSALEEARQLIEKANETREFKYVDEAYSIVTQAEKRADQALLEAQKEFIESMGEGESVVEDHPDWHHEYLEADSFIMRTIKQARSVCGSYSRDVNVPSSNLRIVPFNFD